MKLLSILITAFLLLSCKSSHKLTGTDYVDLSAGQAINTSADFPQEIADSLGWGDLTSGNLKKVKEEIRFSLSSEFKPYHLFKISVKRKVTGESVLYWPKSRGASIVNAHANMEQYLKGRCNEFFQTINYEYCKPEYVIEPDWGNIYSNLEKRNIWQISGAAELDTVRTPENIPDSIRWVISTQVRLGDYFRSYTHINPDQYPGNESKTNLMAIITQLQLVSANQQKPENFNVYSGVTTGKKSSAFKLCEEKETWRFNGNLAELLIASGYPAMIEESEDQYFYVTVSGTVEDEWYGNRGRTGFTKVIRPGEVNDMIVLSNDKCPGNTP